MERGKGRDLCMTIYLQGNTKACTYHTVRVHIDRENCGCDWGHPQEDWYLSVLVSGVYSIQSHERHLALFEPVVP